jgi:hypothetical protein
MNGITFWVSIWHVESTNSPQLEPAQMKERQKSAKKDLSIRGGLVYNQCQSDSKMDTMARSSVSRGLNSESDS